jgi:tetratricopeptide (TPR) repeat protein
MLEKSKLFFTNYWHYLIFIFISLFVYKGVFSFEFVNFDDHLQVTENIRIQGLSFQHLKVLFTTETVGMYQPLTSFILSILFYFAEFNAGYYHLFSLVLHIINGCIVYAIFMKILKKKTASILGTLLFLVHPIMVESVLWVSATSTLLYAFCFLISIIYYLKFNELGKKKHYYLTLFFFVLGILCKIQMITFVGILFLIDWFYSKKLLKQKEVLQKIPFLLIAITFVIVAFFFRDNTAQSITTNYPAWMLVPNQITWYLYKYLAPFSLTILYDWPTTFGIREYLFSFIFTGLIFSFIKFKHNKLFVFGSLFFIITLGIHTAFFIQFLAPYADRYGYISFIGFLIALFALTKKLKQEKIILTSLFFFSIFSYASKQQISIWKNSETLWTHNLKSQKNIIAYRNRATYFVKIKQHNKATEDIKHLLKSEQSSFKEKGIAYYYLGIINYNKNRLDLAEKNYLKSIYFNPSIYDYFYNLGNLYSEQQKHHKAIEFYTKGIQLNNQFVSLLKNRANTYYQIQQYKKALKDLNKALLIIEKRTLTSTRDASLLDFKKKLLMKINNN